jgi:H-NS histone family
VVPGKRDDVRMWEYKRIALNDLPRKTEDVDVLNDAGDDGWEMVAILPNNIVYLKREIEFSEAETAEDEQRAATDPPRILSIDPPAEEVRSEVKAKYRDPQTGDTWSGRGRMATWLKRKQDAGEDIETYLV